MTSAARTLPDTMTSPETGAILRRDSRPFELRYKGETMTVDLPGYYPDGEGDGVHVGDDMAVADEALRGLIEPSGPTSQLLRLLDRHPELIEDLR